MKLMRVVDQWMKFKDLQQALLRNAAINDVAFSTLAQALVDCNSLQTLDLSQNLLTMDRHGCPKGLWARFWVGKSCDRRVFRLEIG